MFSINRFLSKSVLHTSFATETFESKSVLIRVTTDFLIHVFFWKITSHIYSRRFLSPCWTICSCYNSFVFKFLSRCCVLLPFRFRKLFNMFVSLNTWSRRKLTWNDSENAFLITTLRNWTILASWIRHWSLINYVQSQWWWIFRKSEIFMTKIFTWKHLGRSSRAIPSICKSNFDIHFSTGAVSRLTYSILLILQSKHIDGSFHWTLLRWKVFMLFYLQIRFGSFTWVFLI